MRFIIFLIFAILYMYLSYRRTKISSKDKDKLKKNKIGRITCCIIVIVTVALDFVSRSAIPWVSTTITLILWVVILICNFYM